MAIEELIDEMEKCPLDKLGFRFSVGDIEIVHSPPKYHENPATFLAQQLKSHLDYLANLKTKALPEKYKELNSYVGKVRDVERVFGLMPQGISRMAIGTTMAFLNLEVILTEGVTTKRLFDSVISSMKAELSSYVVIKRMIGFETKFYEAELEKAEDSSRGQLSEMVDATREIGIAYERMIGTSRHLVEEYEGARKILGV